MITDQEGTGPTMRGGALLRGKLGEEPQKINEVSGFLGGRGHWQLLHCRYGRATWWIADSGRGLILNSQ